MSLSAFVSMLQEHGASHAEAASSVSPTLVWMVPLLPVFGFVFQVLIGRKLPKPVSAFISCAVVFASCVIAWTLFFKVRATGTPIIADIGPWIQIPGFKDGWLSVIARHKLIVDQLTCVMILVITNIGFLIHVYSTGYMAEEKRFARYFSYLNLFTGFMLILVMASNVLLMFVGWEGVGLCSYLLIGFWFEKKENASAGMKAFVVNRVGDLAFTIGALTLFVFLGRQFHVWTIDFEEMKQVIQAHKDAIPVGLATFVGIMLFIGATGKSAQVPLYVWLPDAMAGPTPVSALIHAATMVTAGVYMIARMNCLFSGSGSVIHGMGGEQDIRKMGGLKAKMPITFWTFLIASLALSGVPPLAGFFSKDEILWQAWSTTLFKDTALGAWFGKLIWLVGATAAACTAFYMTRLVIKTFLDRPKWGAATAFSGGGLPDWMDEDEKKKDDTAGGDLPADESILDLGNIRKKPKKEPEPPPPPPKPAHDDESHPAIPSSLLQDESLLDLGAVGRKPKASHEDHGHASDLTHDESMHDLGRVCSSHGAPAHDAHDAHAATPHDAGHGHGDDAGHGHGGHGEPHESPFSMWVALVVLAAGSVFVGFLGVPAALGGHNRFEHWLSPVTEAHAAHAEASAHGEQAAHPVKEGEPAEHGQHNPMEYVLMLVSIGAAFGGIGLAWYIYGKRQGVPAQDFTEKHKELYELVRDKYRVDEFYEAAVINPLLNLNEGTCRFDNEVVDGAVNGAAWVGKKVAGGAGLVDNEVVDAAVNGAAVATQIVAKRVRRAQTGNIKEYLTFALVGGLFVIALFFLYLTREPLLAKIHELFGS